MSWDDGARGDRVVSRDRSRWGRSVMQGQINIQPEPFEFEAESEWEGEAVAPQTLQVRARILWPALGFPAVIAPRKDGSTEPLAGNPSRCICALILSDKQYLGKEDVAHYLRIVTWDQRAP